MKNLKLGQVMVIVLSGMVAGCAGHYSEESLEYKKFRQLPEEKKVSHLTEVAEEGEQEREFERTYLKAGRFVQKDIGGFKFTKHWDKDTRRLTSYAGHIDSLVGHKLAFHLQVITEKDDPIPVFVKDANGLPSMAVIAGNIRDVPTFAREAFFRTMGIVDSAAFGYFGQDAIARKSRPGDFTLINSGGVSQAGAHSVAEGNANADADASVGGYSIPIDLPDH